MVGCGLAGYNCRHFMKGGRRMKRRTLVATAAAAASFLLGSAAVAVAASDSELRFFGKDPGKEKAFACYVRKYDAAHLKAHPRQNVTDMTLFVNSFFDPEAGRQYTLQIGVHFR